MSDLLQDIDEALRRERAEKFWKENGPSLVIGIIALIVFTGAFAAWNAWSLKGNTAQTSLLINALQTEYAATALDAAAQGSLKGSHKAIALIQSAGLKVQDKKFDEAIADYRAVSTDRSAPALWRELALLGAITVEWDRGADEAKAKTLLSDIQPLLKKGGTWSAQAAVLAATIAGDGLKDYKTALKYLGPVLSDATTPASLMERARALDHLYALRNAGTEPETPSSKG